MKTKAGKMECNNHNMRNPSLHLFIMELCTLCLLQAHHLPMLSCCSLFLVTSSLVFFVCICYILFVCLLALSSHPIPMKMFLLLTSCQSETLDHANTKCRLWKQILTLFYRYSLYKCFYISFLSSLGNKTYYPNRYTGSYRPMGELIDNVDCIGTESKLIDCYHNISLRSSYTSLTVECQYCEHILVAC